MKIILPVLITILLLGISCSSSSQRPDDQPDTRDYSLNQITLGVAFPPNSSAEHRAFSITHMNALHVDWCRINQDWVNREPANNNFDWLPLEERLTQFQSAGKKILLTIDMKDMPPWWTALSSDVERVAEFREFCEALLSRFSNQIAMIQFGNEWNWEVSAYLPGADNTVKDQLFIDMSNELYDAVEALPEQDRPSVVLGSLSIDGLRFISYAAGSIYNVEFEKGYLYSADELAQRESTRDVSVARLKNVLSNVNFHVADLHFYDDYQNWGVYLQDFKTLLGDCGKVASNYQYIAGEFGGPHPVLEYSDTEFMDNRLFQYVKTLDSIGITRALFFKLVQSPPSDTLVHPNSFLISSELESNSRYEIMRKFGESK